MKRKTFLGVIFGTIAAIVTKCLPQAVKTRNRGCFVYCEEMDKAFNGRDAAFPGSIFMASGKQWQRWAPLRDEKTEEIKGFLYSTGHWKTNSVNMEVRAVWREDGDTGKQLA